MATTANIISISHQNPDASPPSFLAELVLQMRAHDLYGVLDNKSDEDLWGRFVLSAEARRAIPTVGNPNPKVLRRIEVFYNAVSLGIFRRCGTHAVPLMNISDEGFGRVILTAGKLVVLSRILRDCHRFGFESLDDLKASGEALIAEGLATLARFADVAQSS